MTMLPQIAILDGNTLSALGLAGIITRMMPAAEVCIFGTFRQLAASDSGQYFHYFTSSQFLLCHAAYFLSRQQKTIVLLHGDDTGQLPSGFHTLNVCQSEDHLIRSILRLAQRSHHAHGPAPEAVRRAQAAHAAPSPLTHREHEVLHGIVSGYINKEIAARLGVSLATVISHRKNIMEKLGTKSVSALTIYAVTHGIIQAEDI